MLSRRFAIKRQVTVEEVPEELKEFLAFLGEQEHRLSQAAYELDSEGNIQNHLEALEDCGLSEEQVKVITKIVAHAGIEEAASEGRHASGTILELITKLEGRERWPFKGEDLR
jgi:hypothetical protein